MHEDQKLQVTLKKVKSKPVQEILNRKYVPDSRRKVEVEDHFKFQRQTHNDGCTSDLDWLDQLALSPRGILYKKPSAGRGQNYQWGFTSCSRCKSCIDDKRLPRHAILNKNYVGFAPKCLTDLTEVELAFLSPVKHYSYCFTWQGGKQLKGTLTFMRVEKRSVVCALTEVEALGLNKNILILYNGNFTEKQKRRAKESSSIRSDKVIAAMEWLCANNEEWKGVDLQKARCVVSTKEPHIINRSEDNLEEENNVEETELFTIYYPDQATPCTGGFDEPGVFKEYVEKMAKDGFDVEFDLMLQKDFMNGQDNQCLLNACLLQFPRGIGGMEEDHKMPDGSWSDKSKVLEYLEHLSLLAQKEFQSKMFQLVLYSLGSKVRLLKSARFNLRGKTDAKNLAEGLNAGNVCSAISGRRFGNRFAGTNISRKFLDAVDATGAALPHTNEASKKNRGIEEAMQHHFGSLSIFMTVTWDDNNSFLMQIWSGIEVDDDTDLTTLSDQELGEQSKKRESIRVDYPGFAALNFKMQFKILCEEVVGWDVVNDCAMEGGGAFGTPYAFSSAVEEQGQKTLHTHMMIWIEGYHLLQEHLFQKEDLQLQRSAESALQKYHEHVASTAFFPTETNVLKTAFDHNCTETRGNRDLPVVVDKQRLRELRHQQGYKDHNGVFATCPHCLKEWTYEKMDADFLVQNEGICQPCTSNGKEQERTIPKARMFAKVLQFQKGKEDLPSSSIDASYNHHLSHAPTC